MSEIDLEGILYKKDLQQLYNLIIKLSNKEELRKSNVQF